MNSYRQEDLQRLQKAEVEILADFIAFCDQHELPYVVIGGTAIGAVRHQGFIPWDDDMDVGMLRADFDRFLELAPAELGEKYDFMSADIQKDCLGHTLRMSRKGTAHVSEEHMKWPRHYGIHIDILPFDNVSTDKKERKKQFRRINFWNRLYIIRGIKNPAVPGKGLLSKLFAAGCWTVHYILRGLHVPVDYINRKYTEEALKYNGKTRLYTTLSASDQEDWIVSYDEIFPLKTAKFEGLDVKIMNKNHEMLTRGYGDYMQLPPEDQRINHGAVLLEFGD